MTDAVDRAREARHLLERLGAQIPGFRGYLDRELRREVDQLLRNELASRLEAARDGLNGYLRRLPLARRGALDRLASVEKSLDGSAQALRHAGSGYAGVFDALKVGEEQLAALYRHDLALVEAVEGVEAAVRGLGESDGAEAALEAASASARHQIASRDAVIRSVFDAG